MSGLEASSQVTYRRGFLDGYSRGLLDLKGAAIGPGTDFASAWRECWEHCNSRLTDWRFGDPADGTSPPSVNVGTVVIRESGE